MKTFLFCCCLLCGTLGLSAVPEDGIAVSAASPRYEFYRYATLPTESELERVSPDDIVSRTAAYFISKLTACTYSRESIVPGESVQRVVTRKSDLLKAVQNIKKGLEREVKGDASARLEATRLMDRVAVVALSAFYDDHSGLFEKELRQNRKDFRKQIEVFERVTLTR